jgi:hypothetical protein
MLISQVASLQLFLVLFFVYLSSDGSLQAICILHCPNISCNTVLLAGVGSAYTHWIKIFKFPALARNSF